MHYRASQHMITQPSPASLMLGREMALSLDRLRAPGLTSIAADRRETEAVVTRRQVEMKCHFDRKHAVKRTSLQVLDRVLACRPQQDGIILVPASPDSQPAGPVSRLFRGVVGWIIS